MCVQLYVFFIIELFLLSLPLLVPPQSISQNESWKFTHFYAWIQHFLLKKTGSFLAIIYDSRIIKQFGVLFVFVNDLLPDISFLDWYIFDIIPIRRKAVTWHSYLIAFILTTTHSQHNRTSLFDTDLSHDVPSNKKLVNALPVHIEWVWSSIQAAGDFC